MSFTSALSQASFHNNWTIAWQKKVLHLLTCVIYFHTFPGTSCAVKVYQTLFSLYAKSAWQKKKCLGTRFPGSHIFHTPVMPMSVFSCQKWDHTWGPCMYMPAVLEVSNELSTKVIWQWKLTLAISISRGGLCCHKNDQEEKLSDKLVWLS